MSEHHSQLIWKRTSDTFAYDAYNREHEWVVKDGVRIPASAALDFAGKPGHCDPEEALISALSGCHMLTFLAIASKKRYVVDRYEDTPVGYLEENENGIKSVTRIELRPKAVFSGEKIPGEAELKELHESAHRHCFIANSITSKVDLIIS